MSQKKSTIKSILIFGVLAAVLCLAINCLGKIKKNPLCENCNVIWISMDTLSANHLPCYGYGRDTAPRLCRFARENFQFLNAYSNAHWTLPSFISEFTGTFPSTHKVSTFGDWPDKKIPLLTEILKKAGYKNIVATSFGNPAVPADVFSGRGLDEYLNGADWKTFLNKFSESVKNGQKTFLFIHDYSVHPPYLTEDRPKLYTTDEISDIPHKYEAVYGNQSPEFFGYLENKLRTDTKSAKFDKDSLENFLAFIGENKNNSEALNKHLSELLKTDMYHTLWGYLFWYNWERKINVTNQRQLEFIKALYDQKIHELDDGYFNDLLNFISDKSVKNNTILIISSEHGEEFGEHGQITHKTIYNSNIKIPFIISVPKQRGITVETSVQLTDIVPTILEMTGIENNHNFQGVSLVPLMKGKDIEERIIEVNGEGIMDTGLIWKSWKLLLNTNDQIRPIEMYNLLKDPEEKNNVLFSNSFIAGEIIKEYKNQKAKWSQN